MQGEHRDRREGSGERGERGPRPKEGDARLAVPECVHEVQRGHRKVHAMSAAEQEAYLRQTRLPTVCSIQILKVWPHQPGSQETAALFIGAVSDLLVRCNACHPDTQRAAFLFVKSLMDPTVAKSFAKKFNEAEELASEHFPMVLALEALMRMYTSTRAKSTFETKFREFKWIDRLGVWNNSNRIQELFDEAQLLATSLAHENLDGRYEMPSAVEQRAFVIARLPTWAKAVHQDSSLDTSTPELLWAQLLRREELIKTTQDAASSAAAGSQTRAPLHPMGQWAPEPIQSGAPSLQDMSVEAGPMVRRLLQYQRETDRALNALYAVGEDVDGLGFDLEDPRSRRILQDFADFDMAQGGVVAGLHALPGYSRIQGKCFRCGIVGHKYGDCDLEESEAERRGDHHSLWPLQVANNTAGPVARAGGRGRFVGGYTPAPRFAPLPPPPPYAPAAMGPPPHPVRGAQAYTPAAMGPPQHPVRGSQAYRAAAMGPPLVRGAQAYRAAPIGPPPARAYRTAQQLLAMGEYEDDGLRRGGGAEISAPEPRWHDPRSPPAHTIAAYTPSTDAEGLEDMRKQLSDLAILTAS